MAENYGGGENNRNLIEWIVVTAALAFVWPVGLVLLFLKLNGRNLLPSDLVKGQSAHPHDRARAEEREQMGQTETDTSGWREDLNADLEDMHESVRATMRDVHKTVRQNVDEAKKQASGYNYRYNYRQKYGAGGQNTTYRYGGKQNAKVQQPGTQRQQPGMQGMPRSNGRKPVNLSRGKGMTVWGGILAGIFGFASAVTLPLILFERDFQALLGAGTPLLGFLGLGLVLLFCGMGRTKKSKRFRKYLALIGTRESIAIQSLAQAMPASLHTACDDLQEMLDEGYLPTGYLDMSTGRLMLTGDGLREEMPPQPEEETQPQEETLDEDSYLTQIRQANDAIADPEMSAKIDRIGEITGKILDYQQKNPSKSGQLRSFLSYYLPTTLKILRAYAQMEAQGIEGENIRAAKERIEGMMDKVVEGFEKQLDKLFEGDAMDITTDVEVLERMLDKDGLSGGSGGFQMGI